MSRSRVTYQSEAVFVADNDKYLAADIKQLTRVQSANYNFNITRQDVNQYGQVGRIDSLILEAPTVALDLSYLFTNGKNESFLNFNVDGSDPFYKGILEGANNNKDNQAGRSYYILTGPDGEDVNESGDPNSAGNSLIKIGNGYINEWSLEVAVGALPTVSCSFEAANIEVTNYDNNFGLLPALDLDAFKRLDPTNTISLPTTITEDNDDNENDQVSALRPADIAISLSASGDAPVETLTTDISGLVVTVNGDDVTFSGSVQSNGKVYIDFSGTVNYKVGGVGDDVEASWYANFVYEVTAFESQSLEDVAQGVYDALQAGSSPTGDFTDWIDWPSGSAIAINVYSTTVTLDPTAVIMASATLADIDGDTNADDSLSENLVIGSPSTNSDGGQPAVIAKQLVGSDPDTAIANTDGAAHIQSFNLSIPFSRTPLQRIGSLFSFARPLDLPTNATFTVNALVSDLNDGKLMDKLCQKNLEIKVFMREPTCPNIDDGLDSAKPKLIELTLKDVELESESIGSSIGDNKTVDLTFNVGIHGTKDKDRGIFMKIVDV
jgi:hypothetical protein